MGTLRNFQGLSAKAATEAARYGQRLVVGPWTHARPSLSSTGIGGVDFGPEAGLDSAALMERWFRQLLKGEDTGILRESRVKLFIMGDNRWRDEEEWPLSRAVATSFFLREGKILSREAPGDEAPDSYLYDPWNPLPTPTREGYSRSPLDTTTLEKREDVLVYVSSPLTEPLEATGYIQLVLHIASSAPDTDFTGKLLDVSPDGSMRSLTEGILRARYRNGFDRPELLTPGKAVELTLDLGATGNVFLPGHRIRLEVSSSNFPRFDRNPNTGGVFGEDVQPVVAEQTIYHDRTRPSRLVLPVVPRPPEPTLERTFAERISRARISEFHRRLTERPHRSGTDGARAVAQYLESTLREAGLEVEVEEYQAFLSAPKRVSVDILSPSPESLSLWEPADPRDPDSSHPELEPAWIAFSGSGSVTGDVIYAGYGLPDDYDGIDARGKIVLVRYGKSHRAVRSRQRRSGGLSPSSSIATQRTTGRGRGQSGPKGRIAEPITCSGETRSFPGSGMEMRSRRGSRQRAMRRVSIQRRPQPFRGFPRFLCPRTRLRRSWSPCLEEFRCASTSKWRMGSSPFGT